MPEIQGRDVNGSCHKCGGLLVAERALDFYGSLPGWKCLNCGWCRWDSQQSQRIAAHAANRGAYK